MGSCAAKRPKEGRFLNAEDIENRRRVVFLGSEVSRKLFGNSSGVGERIRIKGVPFDVIGVGTNKVQISSYYSPDKYCVFIPYSTVSQLWSDKYLYTLVFQSLDPIFQEHALQDVRRTLGERHNFDPRDRRAVTINDSVENMRIVGGITDGLKIVLTFIGGLTLMIGGVGVMNIMLVSVNRTDPRDRCAESVGSASSPHPDSVLDGIDGNHLHRGNPGCRPVLHAGVDHRAPAISGPDDGRPQPGIGHHVDPVIRHPGRIDRNPCSGGSTEWNVAGLPRFTPGSHRIATLRVTPVEI